MEAVPGQGELTSPGHRPVTGVPVTRRGAAAELHAIEPSGSLREAWWLDVVLPAIVLGSTQRDDVIDADACRAAGVDVVRRRSGGGAVLVIPGEVLWLDVIVPRGDPLWDDDVGRSMWWLGDAWASALRALGVDDVDVHRGAPVETRWSRVVCFDGLGSGEVTVGGRKAVGISQRRTRQWARLQSAVHLVWRPEVLVGLLARREPGPVELAVSQLSDVWTVPPHIDAAALCAAVVRSPDM